MCPEQTQIPRRESGDERRIAIAHAARALIIEKGLEGLRTRDIAERVGITERATQRIVAELTASGYLEKERDGRRNRYRVVTDRPLRHPVEGTHTIGELLRAVAAPDA